MTNPHRRNAKKTAVAAIHAVEAMLRTWDPIGIAPGEFAPADEYDSYAPRIVSLLTAGASVEGLANHLERIRTGVMGLAPDRGRDLACAEELVAWWNRQTIEEK
jgi:hypothetical protein